MRKVNADETLKAKRTTQRKSKGGLHKAELLYPRLEGKKADKLEQAFLDMIEARSKWERLRDEEITPAVVEHGVHDDPDERPEQAVLLIGDYKVANQGTRRAVLDKELAAALIEKKLPKLAEKVLVEKVVLDVEAYNRACADGKVPEKLRAKIERASVSYGLRWWPLPTVQCPGCNAPVDKESRFCPKCGESMPRNDKEEK